MTGAPTAARPGWNVEHLSALLLEEWVDAADIMSILFLTVFADASERTVHLPGVIESLSQELTAALRSAARLVQSPGTETLEAELRSLKGARAPGVPLLLAVLVVLLVLLLVISATWLFGRTHQATTVPTLVESQQSVSPQARVLPAQVQAVPVYYIGRQDGKLHREFRNLAASGDLVSTVVNAILAVAPLDPDYRSAWNPGGVIGVSREGSVVTVNLSADAFPDGTDQELTQQAIGQVVQTVHEVLDGGDSLNVGVEQRRRSGLLHGHGHDPPRDRVDAVQAEARPSVLVAFAAERMACRVVE